MTTPVTTPCAPRRLLRPALAALAALAALPPAVAALPTPAAAQQPARPSDTLHLGAMQAAALQRDPRAAQVTLLAAQSALRLRSLDAERFPLLNANAQAQYQSDVTTLPLLQPNGEPVPGPPHDTYDAHVAARQRLYDPTRVPRRELEHARLAESQARVRTTLHTLRQGVNDAYFGALQLQEQRAELAAAITALEAHLETARDRVRLGSALPSEAAMLEAEVLRRRQSLDDLAARRDAALAVLADLTGRDIMQADALALPDLGVAVAAARVRTADAQGRPEREQFARTRETLSRQEGAAAAQDRPRISAFGRAGYGRPGLNPLGREFDEYWIAGVQLEWTPWNWGSTDRQREELALQRQLVSTEEAAFTETIRRAATTALATVDRIERGLAADEQIIALREQVFRETRVRFDEHVITSAEYVDRESDLLAARLSRVAHRVELAAARARFLTLIGHEVR